MSTKVKIIAAQEHQEKVKELLAGHGNFEIFEIVAIDNEEMLRVLSLIPKAPVTTAAKVFNMALEKKITDVFLTVGISANILGFKFLREAIKLVIEKPRMINAVTKELYPVIAEKFNSSPSKVERAIRHAIEVGWARGKIENLNIMFGVKIYGKNDRPTNGEFIALIADQLMIDSAW